MTDTTPPVPKKDATLRGTTTILYALFVIGGPTAIVGIILNYLRKV